MSHTPGVRLALGIASPPAGWVGTAPPYRRGATLGFQDRSVAEIAAAIPAAAAPRAEVLRMLIECRRVLREDGALFLCSHPGEQRPLPDDVRALATMAGLERRDAADASAPPSDGTCTPPGATTRYVKPLRTVEGEPLVTIAIPAYNRAFFATALASAVAQTYPNLEIVVCDDSRDDAIAGMVAAFDARRPVRYLRNEATLGVRANYRRCFEAARGEFVKFLCDDDVLAPGCVAALLDGFRRAPGITLATSHRQRIDAQGARLPDHVQTLPPVRRSAVIAGFSLANVMVMAGVNFIGEPSTALFRKADLLAHAPDYFVFDGVHGHGIVDMVTWSSLLLKGDAVYLRDTLSSFRIHAGQRQHDPRKRARNTASVAELQRQWGALDLHQWVLPEHLLVKPYPPAPRDDWRLTPIRAAAGRVDPATHEVRSAAPGTGG